MSVASRRDFLKGTIATSALFAMGNRSVVAAPEATGMKLSLSVRVAEDFSNKEKTTLSIDQLIALAKKGGYAALCMRASQAGVQSPPERIKEISGKIRDAGLTVSMVTGDFAVPRNDAHGPDCLRKIGPYLDLAEVFGCDLIRVCMKKEEDIAAAQKAADEARERKIRLAHQSHLSSLFETVEGSLRVLKAVGRPNFGLIYEPANWMAAGEDYARDAIIKVKDFLFNVYVQNHRLNPNGKGVLNTWKRGQVRVDHIGLWDQGGVDSNSVFTGLRDVGYHGYVTVHQAFAGIMSVEQAALKSADFLKKFTDAKP